MAPTVRNYIDPTNSYVANIISKPGRNEVQVYPINSRAGSSDELIADSQVVKIELESHETIVDSVWQISSDVSNVNGTDTPNKRGKRKQSGDETLTLSGDALKYNLAVLVEGGDILIFNPLSDKISTRVHTSISSLAGLISFPSPTSIYAYSETPSAYYEISIVQSKVLKTTNFDEEKAIKSAEYINYTGPGAAKTSKPVLFANIDAHLVDVSKTKKAKIASLANVNNQPISILRHSPSNNDRVYVVKDTEIFMYDLKTRENVSSFEASASIFHLQVVSNSQSEALMAFTTEGVQVFGVDFDSGHFKQPPTSLIRTSAHESEIFLTNVWYNNETNQLFGIWYNSNEPKFESVDWKFNSAGEIVVSVDYSASLEAVEAPHNTLIVDQPVKMQNLASNELFDRLVDYLSESKNEEIIDLCSSNDNEAAIKDTVKYLATSNLVNQLFSIVSAEVARDASNKSSLSIWLKWILLINGGAIGRDSDLTDSLKNLQQGLTGGMKLIPHLLALQGRLQLLKSQAELRQQMTGVGAEFDYDSEIENETQLQLDREDQEKGLVFANGENDDEDESEQEEDAEVLRNFNSEGNDDDDEEDE